MVIAVVVVVMRLLVGVAAEVAEEAWWWWHCRGANNHCSMDVVMEAVVVMLQLAGAPAATW